MADLENYRNLVLQIKTIDLNSDIDWDKSEQLINRAIGELMVLTLEQQKMVWDELDEIHENIKTFAKRYWKPDKFDLNNEVERVLYKRFLSDCFFIKWPESGDKLDLNILHEIVLRVKCNSVLLVKIKKRITHPKQSKSILTGFQSSFKNVEIDFNQTSPDYYRGKAKELKDRFRIKFEVEVGEIGSKNPEWPINPPEAFELLKEYYANEWLLLGEIVIFLNRFYSWNEKAMIEKLEEIKQFIAEASKIPLKIAFEKKHRFFHEMPKIVYLRIENNYYNNNHIQYDLDAKVVYGKYFLFKELLEQKLNIKPEKQHETTGFVSNITGFQSILNDQQIEILYHQMNGNYFETTPDHFKAIFKSEPLPPDFIPIKRLKLFTTVLCAYFISELFQRENPGDYWSIAENCFEAKNLRQSLNNAIQFNPEHKPKKHLIIDNILETIYTHLQ